MLVNALWVALVGGWLLSCQSLLKAATPRFLRLTSIRSTSPAKPDVSKKLNPRDERRRILGSANYNRMGFKAEKKEVAQIMKNEFTSSLVAEMRANKGVLQRGDITVKLAENFGFCWGVERAISMAYEARAHYPDQTIHITNEIIHNPQVNGRLHEMDVKFLEKLNSAEQEQEQGRGSGSSATSSGSGAQSTHTLNAKNFDSVQEGDVVILPAFGATIQEMQLLDAKKVKIIDATCPWVSKVWNAVDAHTKAGQTSVIHGRHAHEETIATASFCNDYIIVKDLQEAEYVAKYITDGGDKEEFMRKFRNKVSAGFYPDKHLQKVGMANQTTMYKRETKAIGRLLEMAMLKRYGPAELAERYNEFDTICDATQERQDAVIELVEQAGKSGSEEKGLDFVLVVGGFDSSNTAHLKEIPEKFGVEAFHIDRAECIGVDNTVTHRQHTGQVEVHRNFLRPGPMTIGVTSGASTPDKAMEDALERIFLLHKLL